MGQSGRLDGMRGALDRFVDRLLGSRGTRWAGSVTDLLYEGETVRREVTVGDNRVVVTSHRLLAFTPTRGGENYHQVDVPNVADIRAGYDGEGHLLVQAAQAFLYGLVLLAVGVFVDFGAFVPTGAFENTGAAGRIGLGGVIELMQRLLGLVARLDDVARAVGALLVLFAVFVLAVYLLTRDRAVVVRVAGEADDVVVPASEDAVNAEAAVADLERALFDSDSGSESESAEPKAESARPGVDSAETGHGADDQGADTGFGDSTG